MFKGTQCQNACIYYTILWTPKVSVSKYRSENKRCNLLVSKQVTQCFTPSQPLYPGDVTCKKLVYIIIEVRQDWAVNDQISTLLHAVQRRHRCHTTATGILTAMLPWLATAPSLTQTTVLKWQVFSHANEPSPTTVHLHLSSQNCLVTIAIVIRTWRCAL